jgi:hypothetical protein
MNMPNVLPIFLPMPPMHIQAQIRKETGGLFCDNTFSEHIPHTLKLGHGAVCMSNALCYAESTVPCMVPPLREAMSLPMYPGCMTQSARNVEPFRSATSESVPYNPQ